MWGYSSGGEERGVRPEHCAKAVVRRVLERGGQEVLEDDEPDRTARARISVHSATSRPVQEGPNLILKRLDKLPIAMDQSGCGTRQDKPSRNKC